MKRRGEGETEVTRRKDTYEHGKRFFLFLRVPASPRLRVSACDSVISGADVAHVRGEFVG